MKEETKEYTALGSFFNPSEDWCDLPWWRRFLVNRYRKIWPRPIIHRGPYTTHSGLSVTSEVIIPEERMRNVRFTVVKPRRPEQSQSTEQH